MPGVPSGKGCQACRSQKKKCNQVTPKCSRCARLGIACVGAGQQRYVFTRPKVVPKSKLKEVQIQTPVYIVPGNDLTDVVGSLIAALEVTDLRYSLGCYGDFFRQIPRRLGYSEALDAAVRALITVFPSHYTGQVPSEALVHYGHALTTLRLALGRADESLTAETICAVYFVMICQGWIGRFDHHLKSHSEILAHLISHAKGQQWQEGFELSLLSAVCVPVVLESMANPDIHLSAWFLNIAESYGSNKQAKRKRGIEVPSLGIQRLARISKGLRDPHFHLPELIKSYRELRSDQWRLSTYLTELSEDIKPSPGAELSAEHIQQFHQFLAVYGILLLLMSGLNFLLNTLDPSGCVLPEDLERLARETISLARLALPYRPLGSSYIPPCLATSWAACDNAEIRAELEQLLALYQTDFPQIQWMTQATWLRGLLESRVAKLSDPTIELAYEATEKIYVSVAHHKAAFGNIGTFIFPTTA